jgi:hypothetical protein
MIQAPPTAALRTLALLVGGILAYRLPRTTLDIA